VIAVVAQLATNSGSTNSNNDLEMVLIMGVQRYISSRPCKGHSKEVGANSWPFTLPATRFSERRFGRYQARRCKLPSRHRDFVHILGAEGSSCSLTSGERPVLFRAMASNFRTRDISHSAQAQSL
jgi:hypothetical protein